MTDEQRARELAEQIADLICEDRIGSVDAILRHSPYHLQDGEDRTVTRQLAAIVDVTFNLGGRLQTSACGSK